MRFLVTEMRFDRSQYPGSPETTITLKGYQDESKNFRSLNEFQKNLDDAFIGNVIVKCNHCGQWAAIKTSCWACGAPVDP